MRTIVVGYDGSETARRAVAEAMGLARGLGAELHIVNVVDDDRLRQGMVSGSSHHEALAAAEKLNASLIDDSADGVACRSVVRAGPAAGIMLDHADEVGADLIVVGNRRVQGLERLLGSVAVEVLRHARCSVYVAYTT